MIDEAIIFAKVLDGNGGADDFTSMQEATQQKQNLWLHLDATHPDIHDVLKLAAPEIDESTTSALLDPEARPRALSLEQGTLVILRGINLNEGDEPADMVAVRFWITDERFISLRYRKSKSLINVKERLEKSTGPRTIGDILIQVSAGLLSYIGQTVETLYDQVDEMESQILDSPGRQLRQNISEIRKSAIMLRRYIYPQKEAINHLRYAEASFLSRNHLRKLQELQDGILRDIEDLDAIRERAQVIKDELINALSDKLNHNLYLISIITAIFLPLGFLTGLFGINIGGMPGTDSEQAFTFFSLALVTLVGLQIILFKWFRWF